MKKIILAGTAIIALLFSATANAKIVKKTYKNGTVRSEKNVVNGKREGIAKTYYKSGKLKTEVTYKNDKKEGIEKGYYENGKLKFEKRYKHSVLNGQSKIYYKNGKLESDFTFEDGLPVKGNKYTPKGEKIKNK